MARACLAIDSPALAVVTGRVVCVPRKLELSAPYKFALVALGVVGGRSGSGRVSRVGLGGRGAVGSLFGGRMRVWQMVNPSSYLI